MPIATTITEGKFPVKVWTEDIEDAAYQQLVNMSYLPFIHKHISVMPDVHMGKGATVGSVVPTIKAIVPAAVGVDIGCGMCAVKLNKKASDLPDDLSKIRHSLERTIPVGFNHHKETTPELESAYSVMGKILTDKIYAKHEKIKTKTDPIYQLGTLGGGNHFIELCLDQNDDIWIMLHSGSRGIGNRIGSYFIERAKKHMEMYHINLPDRDLAYLPENTEDFEDYWFALEWAQRYARANRDMMLGLIFADLQCTFPDLAFATDDYGLPFSAINCHHNYVSLENHFGKNVYVTRKGAVSARKNEMGIIPGSMGAKSFIVRGKGNDESFHSCSHGAGRRMSRTQAKKKYTVEELEQATMGVECRKDQHVIDEIPQAYKDIDQVIQAQDDLVEVRYTLKQVLCIKG